MPAYTASNDAKAKATERLYGLLVLQQMMAQKFGERNYNVFVFGSYLTTRYVEGKSDIDIAIYTEDFELYKCLALYLEAPIYCASLKSQIQFTDYYPERLVQFRQVCQQKLEETKGYLYKV